MTMMNQEKTNKQINKIKQEHAEITLEQRQKWEHCLNQKNDHGSS